MQIIDLSLAMSQIKIAYHQVDLIRSKAIYEHGQFKTSFLANLQMLGSLNSLDLCVRYHKLGELIFWWNTL